MGIGVTAVLPMQQHFSRLQEQWPKYLDNIVFGSTQSGYITEVLYQP